MKTLAQIMTEMPDDERNEVEARSTEILKATREMAQDLHKVGAMDDTTLRKMESLQNEDGETMDKEIH